MEEKLVAAGDTGFVSVRVTHLYQAYVLVDSWLQIERGSKVAVSLWPLEWFDHCRSFWCNATAHDPTRRVVQVLCYVGLLTQRSWLSICIKKSFAIIIVHSASTLCICWFASSRSKLSNATTVRKFWNFNLLRGRLALLPSPFSSSLSLCAPAHNHSPFFVCTIIYRDAKKS